MSLKYAILAVLSHADRTGYELTRKIDGSVANFWPATHQQIYLELKKLADEKLVRFKNMEQQSKPDKKIYSISRDGTKALEKWIAEPCDLTPSKDALLIKLFAAHTVDKVVILNELERHIQIHDEKLKIYTEIEGQYFHKKKLSRSMLAQYVTLRRGIYFETAWLGWANECSKRLEDS